MEEKATGAMTTGLPDGSDPDVPLPGAAEPAAPAGDAKKLSRLERLKQKILKLQGKDPDIYPMW
jgi:hypothetical protein